MIYDPQHPEGRREARILQQIDLFPTLIDYLGFDDSFACFGTSALQQPTVGRQVYYGNGYHVMVSNNSANPEQHDITVIMGDRETGTPENINLLKAIIQQYNHRVINNQLSLQ
jgi:arylsulfatase A-like enzyme